MSQTCVSYLGLNSAVQLRVEHKLRHMDIINYILVFADNNGLYSASPACAHVEKLLSLYRCLVVEQPSIIKNEFL